ncbi:MAG: queuosine precursor transporter [Clostridiaceae bacterium]|nr:queuosine precursor transporter [Clostridiaceae bacterium]
MDQFKKEEKMFLLLSATFISLLVVSNIIAVKTVSFGSFIAPAAVICYALTFAISDTLAEIWGKERTKFVINTGIFISLLSALMIQLAISLPSSPFWQHQGEYEIILGSNFRIVIASLLAYFVSQYHDLWAFHFWKDKTKGKHLWIRNNLSTAASQIIDTSIFIVIAFGGTGAPIGAMIMGQYAIKLIIAIFDTPIVYLLVNIMRKILKSEDTTTAYSNANQRVQ